MAHKWKFTVNDDGSFTAEVVRPEDPVQDWFGKEIISALKNDVGNLKDLLRDGIVLVEKGPPPGFSVPYWLHNSKEAVR